MHYYPFGMVMPGRTYTPGSSYRYGFNGKEMDNEVKGNGVQYDYGFRIYDARLGRFLSVDPLTKKYPWYTPYQFAGDRPIVAIDEDGLEPHDVNTNEIKKDLSPTAAEHKASNDPVAYGNNIEPWKDLLNFKVPKNLVDGMNNRGVVGVVEDINDAWSSNTNFDYYSVRITKLPNDVKDVGELLDKIRLNLGQFLDDKTTVGGYNPAERKKWDSKDPLGAVMSFDAMFTSAKLNLDDASVLTSSYYKGKNGGYWTFSTLNTAGDGLHPIAGTRQFGVSSSTQADGSLTYLFYIRATDRAYGYAEALLQKTIFSSAEQTWNAVCQNIFNYVNNNGGNALIPSTPISKRIPWEEVKKKK